MADQKNLEDQLNILFDDFDDEEAAADNTIEVAAAEKPVKETVYEDMTASFTGKPASDIVDDSALENEERGISFEDFENIMPEEDDEAAVYQEPGVMTAEKAADPADEFEIDVDEEPADEEETETDPEPEEEVEEKVPARKDRNYPSADQMRKESIRFWIFTLIVALLVAAAVLFILNKRGIIDLKGMFAGQETTTTAPETEETTTTTAEETTTTTTAEETTTTAEETSAEEEETTVSEEETTETVPAETSSVKDNYTNMFVVAEGNYTLNIRAAATTDSAIVGIINEFGGGSILEQSGEWYHINSGSVDGYVKAEFVLTGEEAEAAAEAHASEKVKINADSINVRQAASTDAEILDSAVKGAVFAYLGEENGFYHIQFNATYEGYVSMDYASLGSYLEEAIVYSPQE